MVVYKLPVRDNISLYNLNRIATYEGLDIIVENGRAYAIIEVIEKWKEI